MATALLLASCGGGGDTPSTPIDGSSLIRGFLPGGADGPSSPAEPRESELVNGAGIKTSGSEGPQPALGDIITLSIWTANAQLTAPVIEIGGVRPFVEQGSDSTMWTADLTVDANFVSSAEGFDVDVVLVGGATDGGNATLTSSVSSVKTTAIRLVLTDSAETIAPIYEAKMSNLLANATIKTSGAAGPQPATGDTITLMLWAQMAQTSTPVAIIGGQQASMSQGIDANVWIASLTVDADFVSSAEGFDIGAILVGGGEEGDDAFLRITVASVGKRAERLPLTDSTEAAARIPAPELSALLANATIRTSGAAGPQPAAGDTITLAFETASPQSATPVAIIGGQRASVAQGGDSTMWSATTAVAAGFAYSSDGFDVDVALVGGGAGGANAYLSATVASASSAAQSLVLADALEAIADLDGDGLIDIHTLRDLGSVRHNLGGASLMRSSLDTGTTTGCPSSGCFGYELMNDLDFDTDNDGSTWALGLDGFYMFDHGDTNEIWLDGDRGGWIPIGNCGADNACLNDPHFAPHYIAGVTPLNHPDRTPDNQPFNAVFEGNGFTISNLGVSSDWTTVGLFGLLGPDAEIRNLGLVDILADLIGNRAEHNFAGALAGIQQDGTIIDCYATGRIEGGHGDNDIVGGLVGLQDGGGSITGSYSAGSTEGGHSDHDHVGGLVGYQHAGSITNSYASGIVSDRHGRRDYLGGLVGWQSAGGSIAASYATGGISGGIGREKVVGGLVGLQAGGSITASYATGNTHGADSDEDFFYGHNDYVGGLVGYQIGGSIAASYATGDANGGQGLRDWVGGLVGYQGHGSITASYATGAADGGDNDDDRVGLLIGLQEEGDITASWGFGFRRGAEHDGLDGSPDRPAGVDEIAKLTFGTGDASTDAPASWNAGGGGTKGVWDFGTSVQYPALAYANYGHPYHCASDAGNAPASAILIPNCLPAGTLIPGQRLLAGPTSLSAAYSASDQISLEWHGARNAESFRVFRAETADFGAATELTSSSAPHVDTSYTDSGRVPGTTYYYWVQACANSACADPSPAATVEPSDTVVDSDGDGLIDITSLAQLNNIRHNLEGSSYRAGPSGGGNAIGCPGGRCIGYELMHNLDFDGPDADTSAWTVNPDGTFTLDTDDDSGWFDVEAGGWTPIGAEASQAFNAIFEGNGNTIANLAVSRDQRAVGMFGYIGAGADIRNLGLIGNLADYTGDSRGDVYIGGLVGYQDGGSIVSCHTTGSAYDGDGDNDSVGGLVGYLNSGSITDSYATGPVTGSAFPSSSRGDHLGGLVGYQDGGSIASSYATGDARVGGDDEQNDIGGLVGYQNGGSITASYATGSAGPSEAGHVSNRIGGLVGQQNNGSIVASYATGPVAHATSGGGLVGRQDPGGSITASYATGSVEGQADSSAHIGGLVGQQEDGSITASYATGNASGLGGRHGNLVGGLVGYQNEGGFIAASYATGDADGGDSGSNDIGGLVGYQFRAIIIASYATGSANGGDGYSDSAGGLVGGQGNATIIASYATGSANGGDGDSDSAGGLVGEQNSSFITASYATGDVDGGDGDSDHAGRLVGQQNLGYITSSWGFGLDRGLEAKGSSGSPDRPSGVDEITQLTADTGNAATDAPPSWNAVASDTLGAWNFGSSFQYPALAFADYDGPAEAQTSGSATTIHSGGRYHCDADADNAPANSILIPNCLPAGTLLPGQRLLSGPTSLSAAITSTSGDVLLSWQGVRNAESYRVFRADNADFASAAELTSSSAPHVDTSYADTGRVLGTTYHYWVQACAEGSCAEAPPAVAIEVNDITIDSDGDGLIDITTLAQLDSIRNNLDGSSYRAGPGGGGSAIGCPGGRCIGYELMNNLDFDGPDADTSTWTAGPNGAFTLDRDDDSDWFDAETGGWIPVGGGIRQPFNAVFEGNGNTIANLATSRNLQAIGMFGYIGASAEIRNLGLINNLASYTGNSTEDVYIGGLAGYISRGSISNSHATGSAHDGEGYNDSVGGLVGYMRHGSITASHASGKVNGSTISHPIFAGYISFGDHIGGLVGYQKGGGITDSYATGMVRGGDYGSDNIGGLVGYQNGGIISESHATGSISNGGGGVNSLGGLVGQQARGAIVASYATGSGKDSSGVHPRVGGLVGLQGPESSITASYATGSVSGRTESGNFSGSGSFGGLVGQQFSSFITASYATGNAKGGIGDFDDSVGGLIGIQQDSSITASYATGSASDVGDGEDSVGGLVGRQGIHSIIAVSYATGSADGGNGDFDSVGALVGQYHGANIISSWGFGASRGGEFAGSGGSPDRPSGVDEIAKLTFGEGIVATDAPASWNIVGNNALGAWDFGTSSQNPALAYADYDGPVVLDLDGFTILKGGDFHCANAVTEQAPAPAGAALIPECTSPVATLIPGQRPVEDTPASGAALGYYRSDQVEDAQPASGAASGYYRSDQPE